MNIEIKWSRNHCSAGCIEIGKNNKESIFAFLHACFVITHSSGDFIDKNIRNHRLYILQICIIGVAVKCFVQL